MVTNAPVSDGDYTINMTPEEYQIFQTNQQKASGGANGGSGSYNIKLTKAQFEQYQTAGYFNGLKISATQDGKISATQDGMSINILILVTQLQFVV